jgi:hypothetical protein
LKEWKRLRCAEHQDGAWGAHAPGAYESTK